MSNTVEALSADAAERSVGGTGPEGPLVDRRFVRLSDNGLMHVRSVGLAVTGPCSPGQEPPVLLLHAGPGSSAGLVPLIKELGRCRVVIAPDTPGYGDSDPPPQHSPQLTDYMDRMVELLDRLGIEQVDVCGQHTGAHIACELALHHPHRVRRLMLDGIALFEPALLQQMKASYAPAMRPDELGSHLTWAWRFVADLYLHFPYFLRDPAHRLHHSEVPPAAARQGLVLDLIKALPSYHLAYQAVFAHPTAERLVLLRHPTLLLAAQGDPLAVYLEAAAALVPGAQIARPSRQSRGAALLEFIR
ncbi:alpha/beta fold hydrolase [Roseateles sp. SL47]|uniref:alpha/beta hydrolase n=1 Tax=Roseateles sp. SL47 TaxID=2995138 RepID=UPI002270939D|nr:alpha/beta fold hydrolase [Roseateles sp. SL47]WAC71940.1 alpha/beta fold hydrolase [Roseateles sp. SL47]